jgi:hypothetical protein
MPLGTTVVLAERVMVEQVRKMEELGMKMTVAVVIVLFR